MKTLFRLMPAGCALGLAISLLAACGNNGNGTSTADSQKSVAASNRQGSPLGTAPDTQILVVDSYKPPVSTAA